MTALAEYPPLRLVTDDLVIQRATLCPCGRRDNHAGPCTPGRTTHTTTGPATHVLHAIDRALVAAEQQPDLFAARLSRGHDCLQLLHALTTTATIRQVTAAVDDRDPDQDRQIRQVLAELELISHGTTQAWNPSGGQSGEPDDKIVLHVARGTDTPPHTHYRNSFDNCRTIVARWTLLDLARADLNAHRRSDPDRATGADDREILEDRILTEGKGWPADDVARIVRCSVLMVRKVRSRHGRDAMGHQVTDDATTSHIRDRARQLLANGLTERQVAIITGLGKTTIRRIAGKAA